MRNLFLIPILFSFVRLNAQTPNQQQWNRPMQLRTCNINIKANDFTATTFLELEFYNPNDKEIEGRQFFDLAPGQVVTAFQLMLNDKYRDGSIEEKRTATNVYNTIVGKRVDPAILKLEYGHTYSLHIYPIPPRGSRKVTITIQEILRVTGNAVHYTLPLRTIDSCKVFLLDIDVNATNDETIQTAGLIENMLFEPGSSGKRLQLKTQLVSLRKPITFSTQVKHTTLSACTGIDGRHYFALRHQPNWPMTYKTALSSATVYWDISGSAADRDIKKEISFLQQFISHHKIRQLTLIPFNYQVKAPVVFSTAKATDRNWQHYLQQLEYGGATQLGCINAVNQQSDVVLIFTDGINTYGKRNPSTGNVLAYAVNSSKTYNEACLNSIAGSSGGGVINLAAGNMYDAVSATDTIGNWLLNVTSASGKIIPEQVLPLRYPGNLFLSGMAGTNRDTVYLQFGNGNKITQVDTIYLADNNCDSKHINRISMLYNFSTMNRQSNWESILEFGLKEKIVTANTAYLVLEKASDYARYNIAPPEELAEECRQMNYVKKDTRWERKQLKKASEYEIFSNVVKAYNAENLKRDPGGKMITLNQNVIIPAILNEPQMPGAAPLGTSLTGSVPGVMVGGSNALSEVVVVGYGATLKQHLTGSVTVLSGNQLGFGNTVEQALQGKVAGMQITESFGTPGAASSIRIRGAASLSGQNTPLLVLDGMSVNGNINDLINTNDIASLVVLKDAQAGALYGSRASNGVIIINSKKGRNYNAGSYHRKYKLADMADVDYMIEWNNALSSDKKLVYNQLSAAHEREPGFFFDMADAFYKIGEKDFAMQVLMHAPEVGYGVLQLNLATAYILESWGNFKEAVQIYEALAVDYPEQLCVLRNLAWAYYQHGMYQQAVNTMFAALRVGLQQEQYYVGIKAMMLKELNAIISMHRHQLDISAIPGELIQPVSADLRIVLDCNNNEYLSGISVKEPGGHRAIQDGKLTKNGGLINTRNYYRAYVPTEYQVNKAINGRYKINTEFYDYSSYPGKVRTYVRIMHFTNFGKADQQIAIENVVLDNQYGDIEIGSILVK